MAKCLNEIRLIGIVATHPTTINENPLGVKFKLATFKVFYSKKKEEYVKQTEFHLVKAWTKDAEFVLNRVEKGEKLFVGGEMHYYERTFEDRMIQKPEVIANNVIQLQRKDGTTSQQNSNQQSDDSNSQEQASDSMA